MDTKATILKQLAENPVILYMKGTPGAPECGFSAKAAALLNETKIPYTYVNVLKAPFIREKLPKLSHWPTYPQLFINGELIGGCDIIEAMHKDGSLAPMLKAAAETFADTAAVALSHAEVEALIAQHYPQAEIIIDGQGCDLTVTVISARFAGMPMVKQHQGVMAALQEPLASGRLHALTLKTFTPGQRPVQALASSGLLQIQS